MRRYTIVAAVLAISLCGCDQRSPKPAPKSAPTSTSNPVGTEIRYQTARAVGTGATFDDALQNALVLAVGEVKGARVAKVVSSERLVAEYHEQSSANEETTSSEAARSHAVVAADGVYADNDGTRTATGVADVRADVKSQSTGTYSTSGQGTASFDASRKIVVASSSMSGVVRRFQVVSSKRTGTAWSVTVVAEIPEYKASLASKRLKIAVLPFRLTSANATNRKFEQHLRSDVVDLLSQSGKVAMLDRDYTEEDQQELSLLQHDDFSKEEAAKFGNRLGADFIIVGTVSDAKVTRETMYMQTVGKRVYGATHADATVTYRMIEAATGVVQLADSLTGKKYSRGSIDAVADQEAGALAGTILKTLYPLRVEAVSDGVFYLGQGGDTVHIGEAFDVFREGHPIMDSYTHEVIGHDETKLARIVVTDVEPKLSKARVIDGKSVKLSDTKDLIARPAASRPRVHTEGKDGGAVSNRSRATSRLPSHGSSSIEALRKKEGDAF